MTKQCLFMTGKDEVLLFISSLTTQS